MPGKLWALRREKQGQRHLYYFLFSVSVCRELSDKNVMLPRTKIRVKSVLQVIGLQRVRHDWATEQQQAWPIWNDIRAFTKLFLKILAHMSTNLEISPSFAFWLTFACSWKIKSPGWLTH